VVQTLLRQAGQAVRRFADPDWRETGLALMADALRRLLRDAPPGSDAQLAYLRAFAGTAACGDDLALLAGLLDGSVVLDGVTVDTELRWALLARLVSRGFPGFGEAEIQAELARDATDAGERHAATCRAAVPVAAAKQAAWDTLVAGELPLATFRAVLNGFADPDQPELVNPYREKYFAAVGDVWRNWSSAMAQDFASGAYTVCALEAQTVRITDEYLAAADPPAALHRLLLEGRDDVLRALRCQAKDRQARDRQDG
jgi:aminopeptidase N